VAGAVRRLCAWAFRPVAFGVGRVNWLVVARYQEDISWSDSLPAGWERLVVQKDVDVPNEGREASSYLWAMSRLFHEPLDHELVCFAQGNPFDHCPDLLAALEEDSAGFRPLGLWRVECDEAGRPHHQGLPVREQFEALLDQEWPGSVKFTAGAQFVVDGRTLRSRPAHGYRKLQSMMGGVNAWVMERLWEAWLSPA
jgi:hypothetical protein